MPVPPIVLTDLGSVARYVIDRFDRLEALIVALTQKQQQAVNDLASALNTLSANLNDLLKDLETKQADLTKTRDDLAAMAAEEGREQAERERLQAFVDGMDVDLAAALKPLADQVAALNQSMQDTPENGGNALMPTGPGETK